MKRRSGTNAVFFVMAALLLGLGVYWFRTGWRERRYDKEILTAAQRYSVDPALVKAVIWRESKFDPDALGKVGEAGLMQVRQAAMDEWAAAEKIQRLPPKRYFEPAVNILAGTWYLSTQLKRYKKTDNPIPYALSDYNAGHKHTMEWMVGAGATNSQAFLNQMTYQGTRAYIEAISNRREHYRTTMAAGR